MLARDWPDVDLISAGMLACVSRCAQVFDASFVAYTPALLSTNFTRPHTDSINTTVTIKPTMM